jgi:hypothetical protein
MGGKITPLTVSKVFTAITEYLDSKYRGHLYDVKTFSIKPACGTADNFLSSIYAVTFSTNLFSLPVSGTATKPSENSGHEYRLVCKSQLTEEEGTPHSLANYYWNIVFTKEKLVYTDVLEKLERLGDASWKLSPCMHHSYSEGEDYACIILDDLVDMGYYIPKTLDEGLSLGECKLIMKNLARLHALSLGT